MVLILPSMGHELKQMWKMRTKIEKILVMMLSIAREILHHRRQRKYD